MYVCLCNGVTDRQIQEAAAAGCTSIGDLMMRTGCGACCGSCVDMASELLTSSHAHRAASAPTIRGATIALPVLQVA